MRFILALLTFLTSICSLQAQVAIDYNFTKLKSEVPPLSPLPAGKTFNIGLPEGMAFLENKAEVRTYWSPYGLILLNKWDAKSPDADYTFRMVMPGLKIISSEIRSIRSSNTITRSEHFRDYTFVFPVRLEVVDNASGQIIRGVEIISEQEQFKRVFHRNLFITDSFNPVYKKEVGFDSLRQVTRVPEKEINLMKKLEGDIASEAFEKIKTALVHLYGMSSLRADFAVLNPKEKGRKEDYSDYDAAAKKMTEAIKLFNANPQDPASAALLSEAEKFYMEALNNPPTKFADYVPAMTYWNLAEIKLLKQDIKAADEYFNKSKQSNWTPNGIMIQILDKGYTTAKDFFAQRIVLAIN